MIAALRRWKKPTLLSLGTLGVVAAALSLQYSPQSAGWLWQMSDQGTWLLPLISVAALIDSVNPCAFSILLVTIAFLFALGRLRSSVLAIGGLYVAGVFAVYLAIGVGLLQVLHLFETPHFMARLGAALLVGGGALSMVGELVPGFPLRLAVPQAAHRQIATLIDRASLAVAFPLGVLVGLCEFPCTGGPYLMAVGLLHDQATLWQGAGYLLLYNAIFVLPLVLILLVAADQRLVEQAQAWHRDHKSAMRLWGGAAMVALGLLIFAL
ncbi:MAG TPA: cytochrome c biogenesis protein CcdA [bacterium]